MKSPMGPIRCALLALAMVGEQFAGAALRVTHVGCPSLSVASLDRAVAFYTGALDFSVVNTEDSSPTARLTPGLAATTQARTSHLVLGEECLDLTEYKSPGGAPFPADSRANDRWFQHIAIVVSDMDKAYARLRGRGIGFVSNVPQTLPEWNKEAAGIAAFYFRDPDGHYLELIHFPPGKGQAKWQVPSARLFLGIDHTAIAVADTRRSVDFYRDVLHFNVTGSSENYGTEQEHLSGVFNAHVLITSLRAPSGIGIELLAYVSPTSGRPIPTGLHVDDVACWQIPLDVNSSLPPRGKNEGLRDVHWVNLPAGGLAHEAAWIKDPDGHLLELMKP